MNAIKMKRIELLDIVRANKIKHEQEYAESVEDYKKLVLQIATANLKLAKTGELADFKKIKSHPNPPQSYDDSYRRAVRMLELSVDEVIEIEEDVFNQLVLDEWHWKHSFVTASAMYKTGVAL